ncbi:hypothetical protein E5D57_007893 [Metarhizium anisopliae]|nr:hypothetical protein E5D57_007893 [Metarhizium anisopliae]
MASPVVDIDPYGEVFIIIPTAVTRRQAGLGNEEIIAPLESVEGQDRNSLPADRSENDDSDKGWHYDQQYRPNTRNLS